VLCNLHNILVSKFQLASWDRAEVANAVITKPSQATQWSAWADDLLLYSKSIIPVPISSNSTCSISCGFAVQLVAQQIHNKSNKWSLSCRPYNNLYNKPTTNPQLRRGLQLIALQIHRKSITNRASRVWAKYIVFRLSFVELENTIWLAIFGLSSDAACSAPIMEFNLTNSEVTGLLENWGS
jgi:hypothetical protein